MQQKKILLTRIAALRRDLGGMLFHFTRSLPEAKQHPMLMKFSAFGVLRGILRDGVLRGSSNMVKGGHKCVCFTEAPITEMAAIFNLAAISAEEEPKLRYEPYGVAVSKEWLFSKGGRPVIYQPAVEYELLPEQLRYRHVSYDPIAGPDVTWEREWRIATDSLRLDPKETLVIVPEAALAYEVAYEHASVEVDYDRDGTPEGAYHAPSWYAVSLDFFGLEMRT